MSEKIKTIRMGKGAALEQELDTSDLLAVVFTDARSTTLSKKSRRLSR